MSRFFRKFRKLIEFLGFYLYDICKSSVLIAFDVLTPRDRSRPGIVIYPMDARTDREIALFANLITFSPGSMVLAVTEDKRSLIIHVMFLGDEELFVRQVKQDLERRILEVMR